MRPNQTKPHQVTSKQNTMLIEMREFEAEYFWPRLSTKYANKRLKEQRKRERKKKMDKKIKQIIETHSFRVRFLSGTEKILLFSSPICIYY